LLLLVTSSLFAMSVLPSVASLAKLTISLLAGSRSLPKCLFCRSKKESRSCNSEAQLRIDLRDFLKFGRSKDPITCLSSRQTFFKMVHVRATSVFEQYTTLWPPAAPIFCR